ncbi:hypothetical protein FSP39_001026 [Pinctada imbricata]|uniref:Uncharacterized protein n=1 Tax=Pinctada imbricata TaxID=66713 RepID=A0AA88YD72_PINIB|nr:hypothetical protein FSP39_001026 [Pinctada imbricata]
MAWRFRWVVSYVHQVEWQRILQSVYQQNMNLPHSSSWITCNSSFKWSGKTCVMLTNLNQRRRRNLVDADSHLIPVKLFSKENLFIGEMMKIEAEEFAFKNGYKLAEIASSKHGKDKKSLRAFRTVSSEEYAELKGGKSKAKKVKEVSMHYKIEENDLKRKIEKICNVLDQGKDVSVRINHDGSPNDARNKKFKEVFQKVTAGISEHGTLANAKKVFKYAESASQTLTLFYRPKGSMLSEDDSEDEV